MTRQRPDLTWTYNTLLIIWAGLAFTHVSLFLVVYFVKPEVLSFDFSQPILGDNALVVIFLAVLSIFDLAWSIFRSTQYTKHGITEQNPEHLQTGLMIACAQTVTVSLFGMLLAFLFDYQYFYIWLIVGFIGTLLHFPRRQDLEAASVKPQQDAQT